MNRTIKALKSISLTVVFTVVAAAVVYAESGKCAVTVFGGIPFHSASTAVRSNTILFTDTDFDNLSNVFGVRVIRMSKDVTWAGLDFSIRKLSMDLVIDSSQNYGKLTLAPVILGLRFQGKPKKASWGMEGGMGIGLSLNSFDKSQYLKNLEKEAGNLDYNVTTSFVLSIDYGINYYISEKLSLNTNILWMGNTPYIKNLYGLDSTYMNSHTFQLCFGLSYWI